jgi:hypothetical protein
MDRVHQKSEARALIRKVINQKETTGMDGRVLIKGSSTGFCQSPISELAGWSPGPARIGATDSPDGPVAPVSLIVPTFFNSELKQRSLRYLLSGIAASRAVEEIIFVSSDGENRGFNDLLPLTGGKRVRVVEADPHNRGKSRNIGAAAATSTLLLFLDDDMLIRDWAGLDRLVAHLLRTKQECALFPRRHYARFPLLFDPPLLNDVIDHWRQHGGPAGHAFLYDPLAEGARDLPMLFCFPGCFMLIRRDVYQRMEGFNEGFVGWGFEDTEFALRAIRDLKVLNLFRQGEPLLHIDHPVSPYKSEEHTENFRKFYASDHIDVSLFCRRVFLGENFKPGRAGLSARSAYSKPFREIERRGVPLDQRTFAPWYLRLARERLAGFLSPLPQFIALHGSRAGNAHCGSASDFDVLCLFQGKVQSFFVSEGPPRVEVEMGDMHRFENIAARPALHSFQGPMELAKVAGAKLLWGDAATWHQWSSALIQLALRRGWCFWLVYGLGLRRTVAKYGPMVDRYFDSLERLRQRRHDGDLDHDLNVDLSNESALINAAKKSLQREHPGWQQRVGRGESLFELQVPEVWIALHRLAEARPGRSKNILRQNGLLPKPGL